VISVADLKMTPTRIALLRAVADPGVEVAAKIRRGNSWSTADVFLREPGSGERKVTAEVSKLEAAGLVRLGPSGVRYFTPRDYSLTEAGEKVLADHDPNHPRLNPGQESHDLLPRQRQHHRRPEQPR
jgi:hypothetical protein